MPDELESIKDIIERIANAYKGHADDKADRMLKLYDYLKSMEHKERVEKIDKVLNEMLSTIQQMLDKGDKLGALNYFIACLDNPDTLMAYIYMWRPEFTELMLSITTKALELVRVMVKRAVGK